MWDFLLDYGRLKWQRTLQDLETTSNVVYEDVLSEFDKVGCVKRLHGNT